MKVTHKNIDIVLNEANGVFEFSLNGIAKKSASLAAAKTAIDKAEKAAFKQFDAYIQSYTAPFSVKVTIVGKKVRKVRYSASKTEWLDARGNTYGVVFPFTAETADLFATLQALQETLRREINELREKQNAEHEALRRSLVVLKP